MKNTFKYGLYIAATLIGYFLIIDILGLAEEVYLSFFNAILTGGCIFLAIRDVYRLEKHRFNYMEGFQAALLSGLVGTTIFTLFIAVYLFEIRPELATSLKEKITIAGSGIEFALILFVFLSGVATTVVSALVILPLYKQSWNTKKVRKEQNPMHDKH
ncbi:DUF4199 domain-containing protein [Nonlabens agnitus]|uniref:DUF4199 domain-containing protein n=1 Tax=Nonlabens agnitus TaxID=870484 RepID=A0A2S9WVY1_9FLAO|nr:DUF4199 domain-containing protein [Nonlabens agnitus]PRP67629.1 hypothetical protein BST86_11265 [Nonlabens agnitus]